MNSSQQKKKKRKKIICSCKSKCLHAHALPLQTSNPERETCGLISPETDLKAQKEGLRGGILTLKKEKH